MLRLGQEVGGDPGGLRRLIRQDQHLTRPRQHVHPDDAIQEALGRGHVDVARADDLVHGCNTLRPVGQGRDGLRAAHAVDLPDVHERRGRQDCRGDAAVLPRRGADGQARDPRHAGRNGVHENRRGIGGGAARDVQPHPVERPHELPQQADPLLLVEPGLPMLAPVEERDALRREREGLRGRGGERSGGPLDLVRADPQPLRLQTEAVEAPGVFEQGVVTSTPHLLQDPPHGRFHLRRGDPRPIAERLEQRIRLRRACREASHRPAPRPAGPCSRMPWITAWIAR
jgi:hypothetical protein